MDEREAGQAVHSQREAGRADRLRPHRQVTDASSRGSPPSRCSDWVSASATWHPWASTCLRMHVSDLDFGSGCASIGTTSFAPE